jgi:hypothetical protein
VVGATLSEEVAEKGDAGLSPALELFIQQLIVPLLLVRWMRQQDQDEIERFISEGEA